MKNKNIYQRIILQFLLLTIPVMLYSNNNLAPSFALFDTGNNLVTLKNITKNDNVIITFWASYCQPCMKEMPHIISLEKQYGNKKSIKLVLINIENIDNKQIQYVLRKNSIKNLCLNDPYKIVIKKYVPSMEIPATFLINNKGIIVFKRVGYKKDSLKQLEKAIKSL